jgi:hypothetical protein
MEITPHHPRWEELCERANTRILGGPELSLAKHHQMTRHRFQIADGLAAYYTIGIILCAILCYLIKPS